MRNRDNDAHFRMSDYLRNTHPETNANNDAVLPDWRLSGLWELNKIDATVASDYTEDSSNLVVADVNYNHPNLAANTWANSTDIAGTTSDDVRRWDFGIRDNSPIGDRSFKGHRTHIAVRPNVPIITKNDFQTSPIKLNADNAVTPDWSPNDSYYTSDNLWGLKKIQAPAVWDYTKGSKNVVVAVVDTGVDYNHPDLAANIWNPNGIHGWDFGDGDSDPNDNDPKGGHGTHVAGIIGAVGNNGLGVIGVSPNVSIMATKHFRASDPEGYLWDVPKGIYYAVDNGAKIINLSFGSSAFDQAQYDALNYAYSKGVLVIAAAGNSNRNIDTEPHYPASYDLPNIISVTATDQNDQLAYFSNYGANSVDLAAPGVDIYSTFPNNQYAKWNGTSMAVPFVSGAAALLLAANPNLGVLDLRYALLSTVDKVNSLQGKINTGGRLNVLNAYQKVVGNNQAKPDSVSTNSGGTSAESTIHIEAENYKNAYDTTPNNSGSQYRKDLNVDIENTSDVGGGYNIGWVKAGEWLTYDLKIPEKGFYNLVARVSTAENTQKQFKTSIDNQQERILSFGYTGGYQAWTDVITQGLSLSAGSHELRVEMLTDNFNLNYIELIPTNTAYGTSNSDAISGNADNNSIYGGAGNDNLSGGLGNDTIFGEDGNDSINGEDGDDLLYGQNGNDSLNGGVGNDNLKGDAGNDNLNGNLGNDSLEGGVGNDTLNGSSGNDTLNGGDGNDTASYQNANSGVNVNLKTGRANDGLGSTDTLTSIETVISSNYNDILIGGNGNDTLIGGSGNDTLTGGSGWDTLTGGAGADIFVFNSVSEGIDQIADFSRQAGDKIQINGSGYGITATDINKFSYQTNTGALSFNTGTSTIQFASLSPNTGLIPTTDIIIV
ncbi:S8 family serine peptidase [Calothrix sp. NIES-2098]|uniref:S8 family serine peptidase n=1 Tax=Calothrix sp. NIES-2098 TaxID=1954171 RepID=UPI000B60100B|nr:peptidase S8/S53 [Calothrix sp. NIES-2098]